MFTWLDGKKTYIASLGIVLAGLARIIQGIVNDPLDTAMIYEGFLTICGGLGVTGFRSALNKPPAAPPSG